MSLPMPFKKLHENINEKLEFLEISEPTPIQIASIPVIKSGANVYCTAEKGSGKTTTLILTTLHKLKCKAFGDTPRAIVLVENKERIKEIYDEFKIYTRHNSLRVYLANDKFHVDVLKSEIFIGTDILIITPKKLNNLLLMNGVNLSQLQLFSIDDADFLTNRTYYSTIMSITQSISKCQFVLYSEKMHPMLKKFGDYFMQHAKTVSL